VTADPRTANVWMVGGGIASMAAVAFLTQEPRQSHQRRADLAGREKGRIVAPAGPVVPVRPDRQSPCHSGLAAQVSRK
jgi:hypothetical protein